MIHSMVFPHPTQLEAELTGLAVWHVRASVPAHPLPLQNKRETSEKHKANIQVQVSSGIYRLDSKFHVLNKFQRQTVFGLSTATFLSGSEYFQYSVWLTSFPLSNQQKRKYFCFKNETTLRLVASPCTSTQASGRAAETGARGKLQNNRKFLFHLCNTRGPELTPEVLPSQDLTGTSYDSFNVAFSLLSQC